MRKLTILIDMDDTLEELVPAWVKYLNERHGYSVSPCDITDWDMSRFFPDLPKDKLFAALEDAALWDTVQPKSGAQEYVKRLIDDGHRLLIVTASHYKTLVPKMERVLFRYFPFLSWDDVIITNKKQLVRGDVLIDDGTHNHMGGMYHSILMDAGHNRSFDAEGNGMTRVNGWEEAYRAVCNIANQRQVRKIITLYSTDCPQCKVLKKKLETKGILYQENGSVTEMMSLGITQVPVLGVDGELLGFSEANAWINQQ